MLNLKFVRIYFDTPTFERITKDRAAKFVDMLSAIGGTMGLLTGFSIHTFLKMKYPISTALMMENPVRRPMVPPIADRILTNFAALSLVILSMVGVSK